WLSVRRACRPSSRSHNLNSSPAASSEVGASSNEVLALPDATPTPPKTQTVIDSSAFKFRMFVAFLRASSKLSFKSSTLSLSYSCWGPADLQTLNDLATCAHASDRPYNSCLASSHLEVASYFSYM